MKVFPRFALLSVLAASAAMGAPQLTSIEDILYNADGSRFNGVAFIEYRSLRALDVSNIATRSLTAPIVDGLLRVALVPTTTSAAGAYYSVRYYSSGRVQFSEFWSVPPSSSTLKLGSVRIAALPPAGSVLPPPEQTLIQKSDVAGLVEDLEARPVKGPGYAPGRVAAISETGAIEGVMGELTDCVRVDGTAGPCSDAGSNLPFFVDAEIPAGSVNGSNLVFTLTNAPEPAESLQLYRNGLLQQAGVDYQLAGNTITFLPASAPQPGDLLQCAYRLPAGSTAPAGSGFAYTPAQVLCSSPGASTGSTTPTSLGFCAIPANVLQPGDRVEVRFSYSHQGSQEGYVFALRWGGTTLLSRTAPASEPYVTGRAEAGLHSSGAQWDVQSWGTSLAAGVSAGHSTEAYPSGVFIDLLGNLAAPSSDTITLTNYTVVRYPARLNP